MLYPKFIDHLVFRVADLEKVEPFYTVLLGPPVRAEDSLLYYAGEQRLFFTSRTEHDATPFNKEAIGLNHLAFGIRTLEELQMIESHLDSNGIIHSGIAIDPYGSREFIWLDDPEGMRIEFYLRPFPG